MTVASATRHIGCIAIIGVLFFIVGLCTRINGPLATFVKPATGLDDVSAPLRSMAFYLTCFFLAMTVVPQLGPPA